MKTAIIIVVIWWLILEVFVRHAKHTSKKKEKELLEKERRFREHLKRQMEEINRKNREEFQRMMMRGKR